MNYHMQGIHSTGGMLLYDFLGPDELTNLVNSSRSAGQSCKYRCDLLAQREMFFKRSRGMKHNCQLSLSIRTPNVIPIARWTLNMLGPPSLEQRPAVSVWGTSPLGCMPVRRCNGYEYSNRVERVTETLSFWPD